MGSLNNPGAGILTRTGTYTGNGVNQTVAHGCGSLPKLVIIVATGTEAPYCIIGAYPTEMHYTAGVTMITVTAMDATNFYVNAANGSVNLVVYRWIAFY